jgi:hypothetical protein
VPSLQALFVLAWALIRTLVARLFGRTRGLKEFRESYDADRLPSVTEDERATMPTMSGCIACGLCDLGGTGAMELALVGARATIDADAAKISLAKLSDETLRARESLCPTRVPLVSIARLVRERAFRTIAH